MSNDPFWLFFRSGTSKWFRVVTCGKNSYMFDFNTFQTVNTLQELIDMSQGWICHNGLKLCENIGKGCGLKKQLTFCDRTVACNPANTLRECMVLCEEKS